MGKRFGKKNLSLVIILLLLISSITGVLEGINAQGVTLPVTQLLNGSFEVWDNDKPTGWYGEKSNIPVRNIQKYTNSVKSGDYSVKLVNPGTSWQRFTNQSYSIQEKVKYTVAYWVRGKGEIRNNFYRGGTYSSFNPYITIDTDEWQKITWEFTHDESVEDVEIIISIRKTNEEKDHIQIDNVVVTSNQEAPIEQKELRIYHTPTSTAAEIGQQMEIPFLTSGGKGAVTTAVYYKKQRDDVFKKIPAIGDANTYKIAIPGYEITEDFVYYIVATDDTGTVRHPEEGIHTLRVISPPEPPKPISVAEAIANNSGEATVEGYIIGIVFNGPIYQFQEPFSLAINLALGDSPDERNPLKILPVELPAGFPSLRPLLNLKDNPNNLGRKVRLTGQLEAYYTVPGLKGISAYEWVTEQEEDIEDEEEEEIEDEEGKEIEEEEGKEIEDEEGKEIEDEEGKEIEDEEGKDIEDEEGKEIEDEEGKDIEDEEGKEIEDEEEKEIEDEEGKEILPLHLTDIKDHWAAEYIEELVSLGVIRGYTNGSFKPNDDITRAEFVTIIVKAFGLEKKEDKLFDDTQNHWAKEYIATAQGHGIINGYNDRIFGTNDKINREQMTTILVKARDLEMVSGGRTFSDAEEISEWAAAMVETAVAHHIISGYTDGSFKPKNNTTRAEAATIVLKALKL
ncbi:S-layer homology domain-containing protein [Natronincola ferrireducens]|uniref:Carbohydrate binding domain-containing protein n=1 Tax=Natronincola ferrireducens TaxID=393762 RepID=A0A1G8XI35_9FIRM|nr:S-layer homology domain-containing protein [Natronincola ferrireducens]SDJ90242.1 Carbohydrate binding domain-containing protein [Natronincola ferrireducens]